jgi:uncharacterized protein (DUF1330 family)
MRLALDVLEGQNFNRKHHHGVGPRRAGAAELPAVDALDRCEMAAHSSPSKSSSPKSGAAAGGSIQVLHAQAKPSSYVVAMINVKDEEGYKNNFLKEAQKQIADHGGKYVAGGFNKAAAFTGTPPNRVVILQFENIDKVKAWQDSGARELQQKAGAKYADFQYLIAVEATEMK